MVVPVRDLGNKFFIFSANMHSQQDSDSTLPTVSLVNHTGMDSSIGQLSIFNFEMRGRSPTANKNFSRDSSTISSGRTTPYYDRMDVNIDCNPIAADQQVSTRPPQHMYQTRKVSLTYSFLMICKPLQSLIYGVDHFTTFHSMIQSSTLYQMLRTSRLP